MTKTINNVKLGAFVLGGLLFLVVLLYMIGRNSNMFGTNYVLKVRFENVQGLVPGNNVRFSGIKAGTVKRIQILNDTVIEVVMIIDKKMGEVIRTSAVASIGTEGLVGNKVVNIIPSGQPGILAVDGDLLKSVKGIDTDEMLKTLSGTNNDISEIVTGLKSTVRNINSSRALWNILNDTALNDNLSKSVANIRSASEKAEHMAADLDGIISGIKAGEGSLGSIVKDTDLAVNLNQAALNIRRISEEADAVILEIDQVLAGVHYDLDSGKGIVNTLLKDTAMPSKINQSLENIRQGTEAFNQNMEAMKHHFLFRGYFRKQEKKKSKEVSSEKAAE